MVEGVREVVETLTTALLAQVPILVGLFVWLVKRRVATPKPASMTERFIGHLEKQADVTAALATRFDRMDEKLDDVLTLLNGEARPRSRRPA